MNRHETALLFIYIQWKGTGGPASDGWILQRTFDLFLSSLVGFRGGNMIQLILSFVTKQT